MRYLKNLLFATLVALTGIGQTASAQSMGTIDLGAGAHFQFPNSPSDTSVRKAYGQTGFFGSLGVHLFKTLMAEAAVSRLPAQDSGLKTDILALRGVAVLPIFERSSIMFGLGYAKYQYHRDTGAIATPLNIAKNPKNPNAFQMMPAFRLGLGSRLGLRVSATFDYQPTPNVWVNAVQAGISWRFGGQQPPVVTVMEPAPEPQPVVVVEASPLPMPEPEVTPPMVVHLTTVHFAFDRSVLTPIAKNKLKDAAQQLQNDQGMIVELTGHTDAIGSASYNEKLSVRRAQAVRDYLVTLGISNERIGTRGMGEKEPIGDNKTAEGRAKNRRVEVDGKPIRKN